MYNMATSVSTAGWYICTRVLDPKSSQDKKKNLFFFAFFVYNLMGVI